MITEKYETYGDSWKAETMSMRKADIVEIMAAIGKEKERLEKLLEQAREVIAPFADESKNWKWAKDEFIPNFMNWPAMFTVGNLRRAAEWMKENE